MKSYLAKSRLVPLVLIFGMILLIFCGVLYNTQILNGSDYKARSLASNATAQTVEASRGIITDRNGKVLISNRLTYTLVFSDEEFESDTDCNDAIFRLLELCRSNNVKWTDTLPVSKEPPFTYTTPHRRGCLPGISGVGGSARHHGGYPAAHAGGPAVHGPTAQALRRGGQLLRHRRTGYHRCALPTGPAGHRGGASIPLPAMCRWSSSIRWWTAAMPVSPPARPRPVCMTLPTPPMCWGG